MTLGLSLAAFTYLHVAISLVAIASGFVVILAMIASKQFPLLTGLFLITTALTSLTGFLFPFKGITPAIVLGILSILVLVLAAIARRRGRTSIGWSRTYVVASALALYFNFFVLIVQSFQKVPALHALAPTQSETPFKVFQLLALVLLAALTILAWRKYRYTE